VTGDGSADTADETTGEGMDLAARRRLAVGAFVVAGLVGLALELTVLPAADLPLGVQSLFIAVGAAAGMWVVVGEL
jgi:hypothetical protein